MLREIARRTRARTGSTKLSAIDHLDDGSVMALDVEIDEEKVTLYISLVTQMAITGDGRNTIFICKVSQLVLSYIPNFSP